MFSLFGRRKVSAQPAATKATTQAPNSSTSNNSAAVTAPTVPAPLPAPVATVDTPQPMTATAVGQAEAPVTQQATALLEASPAEQQVAVLELPLPVAKPKVLTQAEEIGLDAISFEDICTKCTHSVEPRDPKLIEQEKAALEGRLARTYALETGYREKLQQGINQLKVELDQVELDRNYQRIDMGFLQRRKWSKKHHCPLPLFAAFGLDNPECRIKVDCFRNRNWAVVEDIVCQPSVITNLIYAKSMKEHARRLFEQEDQRSRQREGTKAEISLLARFNGAIPDATRDKIDRAKPQFDELFLVTEAPEWEMAAKVTPAPIPAGDPLVIGRKGELFWLVDAFDLTPLEAAIKGEWTTDKRDS